MPKPGRDTRGVILDSAQRIMSRRGYAAVGINEVLADAGVPKGSFYHFFGSKDAFGEAMMRRYFVDYLADMDAVFATAGLDAAQRLLKYFAAWERDQVDERQQNKCLAVKLGAEVADLSETMRAALQEGVAAITQRIADVLAEGVLDGSLSLEWSVQETAHILYDVWFGASVVAKINRDGAPLATAYRVTRALLHVAS